MDLQDYCAVTIDTKLFQKLFRNTVYRLQSAGLMYKLREDVMQTMREVPPPLYRLNQPLNLTQLAGSVAIISMGLLLAIMVFLYEMFRGAQKLKNAKLQSIKKAWD